MRGIPVMLVTCLVVAVSGSYNFMDCPGNTGGAPGYARKWNLLRRCCTSQQLPKGCECFDISGKSDFTNSFFHKSQCPDKMNVKFLLYTRSNRNSSAVVKVGDGSIPTSPFQGARATKFISHGFTDMAPAPWSEEMKDAILDQEDANVILLDWRKAAKAPNYPQAVANTRSVGAMVARLIQEFNNTKGASFQSFHLIGHSLGAHVSGIAGKEIHRLTSQLLGRITGLDPAGPSFESYSANVRLDKTDAAFVDVIHTDAETLISSGFGTRYSIGHVDFYPNGGKHQPGCPKETGGILSMLDFESEQSTGACSHSRCLYLFTNSISKCRYDPPTGDESCIMGYHTSTSCRGDHYPTTTDKEPFC